MSKKFIYRLWIGGWMRRVADHLPKAPVMYTMETEHV